VLADGTADLGFGHAVAVVADGDPLPAPLVDRDLDPGRAGVQPVLEELLDRRGRTLDDLTGGDALDGRRVELADGRAILASVPIRGGVRGSVRRRIVLAHWYAPITFPLGAPGTYLCRTPGGHHPRTRAGRPRHPIGGGRYRPVATRSR